MHLLPRFDPTSGSISIDGQDIRNVTLSSLRKAVTIVQQDSFFFTTSIENNSLRRSFRKMAANQRAAVELS